jgi:hypothetical protein
MVLHRRVGLQGLGISGDLWCWIADYLNGRAQITIVNGCKSKPKPVKCGVPQGSVLGPILFSLFCNYLPDICVNNEGEILIYADDTTLCVIGPTHELVCLALNKVLLALQNWCNSNLLTPHPGNTEYMILSRSNFTIKLGNQGIRQVEKSRCLVVEIDNKLK